ncbi:hypothetical protein PQX77_011279 [Marasmius sp. AFHP31]|nr:hypothetical protein PQX77_011279 [Marasmius sp. AFHP31]
MRFTPYPQDHSRSRSSSTTRGPSSQTRSREGLTHSHSTAPPSVTDSGGGDDQYGRQTQELELNMGIEDGDMEADEAAIGGALDEIRGWIASHDNGGGLSRSVLQSIGRKAKALSTVCLGEAGDNDKTVRLTAGRPFQAFTVGFLTAQGAGGPVSISRDSNALMADTPAPAAAPQPPQQQGVMTISTRRGPPPRVNRATRPKNSRASLTTYASAARRSLTVVVKLCGFDSYSLNLGLI